MGNGESQQRKQRAESAERRRKYAELQREAARQRDAELQREAVRQRELAERSRRQAELEAKQLAEFARSEAERQAAEAARARAEAEIAREKELKIKLEKEAVEREAALLRAEKEAEEEKARQKPWRELPEEYETWNKETLQRVKTDLKNTVKKNKIGGTLIRILLIGDTGAGKSSLINSMNAALTGEYGQIAMTTARDHATKKYSEYPLYSWGDDDSSDDSDDSDSEEDTLPFLICDFRGFGSKAKGVSDQAVEAALKGIVESDSAVKTS